jgi:hypothetical protein
MAQVRRLGTAATIAGWAVPAATWSPIDIPPAGRFSARSKSLMKSTVDTGAEERGALQPPSHTARIRRVACLLTAGVLVGLFLVAISKFYHPGTGFTSLIGFPEGHAYETPALRAIPHVDYPAWASYDGQFYAQRAFDPLVRDPLVDRAMDLAPFRARRILFSWTAYLAGLGRPAWILEAYALQNVAAWLILAVLLARWMPPGSPRGLATWGACLCSHGLLWSVRFALLDGPSLVLLAAAVTLAETGRPLASAAVAGINGLGRETNILGVLAQPVPRTARDWARLVVACALIVLPLVLWEDYLYSIYRSTIFAGADQLTPPGRGLAVAAAAVVRGLRTKGLWTAAGLQACLVLALTAQACYLVVRMEVRQPWWRVGAGYLALMLVMNDVLWDPATGAMTRVVLPMTVGFNVLLAQEHRGRFWPWFILGNLHVIPGFWVLPPL